MWLVSESIVYNCFGSIGCEDHCLLCSCIGRQGISGNFGWVKGGSHCSLIVPNTLRTRLDEDIEGQETHKILPADLYSVQQFPKQSDISKEKVRPEDKGLRQMVVSGDQRPWNSARECT